MSSRRDLVRRELRQRIKSEVKALGQKVDERLLEEEVNRRWRNLRVDPGLSEWVVFEVPKPGQKKSPFRIERRGERRRLRL